MTSPGFESLQKRYSSDPDFRSRLDDAPTVESAILLAEQSGIGVDAGDIAQLMAEGQILTDDMLDAVGGGSNQSINMTFNDAVGYQHP